MPGSGLLDAHRLNLSVNQADISKTLGDLALREDDLAAARRRYEAALAIYPAIGDRLGEANVLRALGDLALREDDLAAARRRWRSTGRSAAC